VASVNFLMTDRAVLKPRRAKIVKRGRHVAQCSCLRAQIGVAFQANKPDLMPGQHTRIRGTVRLMAALTSFKSHGRVLKGKRASLVRVAAQAARLVRGERPNLSRINRPVRIVAIHAGHRSLGKPVRVRLSELRPGGSVAGRALLVHLARLARDHSIRTIAMNCMARRAAHLPSRVASHDAPGMRRLVEVTAQARLIGLDPREACRIENVVRGRRLGVLTTCAVT
jgi:hypothetical protein